MDSFCPLYISLPPHTCGKSNHSTVFLVLHLPDKPHYVNTLSLKIFKPCRIAKYEYMMWGVGFHPWMASSLFSPHLSKDLFVKKEFCC